MQLRPVLLATVILVSCSGDQAYQHTGAGQAETGPVHASPDAPPSGSASFLDPERLCNSLVPSGMPTRAWRSDGIDWSCSSEYHDIGQAGSTLATNVAYYVIGDNEGAAHTAEIVLNVNDPSSRHQGLQELATLASVLFRGMGVDPPASFLESVRAGDPVEFERGGITFKVSKDNTSNIGTLRVAVSDAAAIAEKARARAASIDTAAGFFPKCKVASRDLNYPPDDLTGDGNPIQEKGYQSFMIEGRNKDLFFCEVYPGNKYRIKAALRGEFPFKYVASGTL